MSQDLDYFIRTIPERGFRSVQNLNAIRDIARAILQAGYSEAETKHLVQSAWKAFQDEQETSC